VAPKISTVAAMLCLAFAALAHAADETVIFADSFQGNRLSPEWEVHEGRWEVADGALTVRDGGIISLKKLPGGSFAMEFEIAFPANWMSVIPLFTGPDDYATLYFGGSYWESFQMRGNDISNYVQRRDDDMARTGDFQKLKVTSDYGSVTFVYDGKEKGPVAFPYRPGARVAFRSLPGSGVLRIRNFRLTKVKPAEVKVVREVRPEELSKGTIWKDRGLEGKPGATSDAVSVDARTGAATLSYAFANDKQFESCFIRLPVDVASCGRVFMEVDADGSQNNFFVIVHDASGEQHLAIKSPIMWQGVQEVGINLTPYLKSPPEMRRQAIHWAGDGNQKIDFPITTIDVGIARRSPGAKTTGQVKIRSIRFLE
jgi:hypothetical protein